MVSESPTMKPDELLARLASMRENHVCHGPLAISEKICARLVASGSAYAAALCDARRSYGEQGPAAPQTDVLDVSQELLNLESGQRFPGVQASKLAGEDEDGVGLRNLHAVDLQHWDLSVLEAAGSWEHEAIAT
jgi:hypothetical protein